MNVILRLVAALLLVSNGVPSVVSAQVDAPYVPTPEPVVEAMLELARVTAADTVLDLGSGDGRIVLAAAERGAAALGIELREELVEQARRAARARGLVERTRFIVGDILEAPWGTPTVVLLYLSPALLRVIGSRLREELPAGARVVSHGFGIPGWEPERTVSVHRPDGRTSRLFLWVVPGPRAGPKRTHGNAVARSGGISRPPL